MRYLTIFPGQGAQKVGMGTAFSQLPLFQNHLAQADELLGYPLRHLMAAGPEAELQQTQHAQLALFVLETAIYTCWQAEQAPPPDLLAGHSLGEYSALYAAGVFSFETALHLVQKRAHWMQADCEAQSGSMAAVIRPQSTHILRLCAEEPQVVWANDNSVHQGVLSGESHALDRVIQRIQTEKWGKVIRLAVSGAFHSPLMQEASQHMAQHLQQIRFQPAQIPVLMNSTAQALSDPEAIKNALIQQILSPVRWRESMQQAGDLGIQGVVEMGPSTLKRLVQQTLPHTPVHVIQTPSELKEGLAFVQA